MHSSTVRAFMAALFLLLGHEMVAAENARADGPFVVQNLLDGRCLDADARTPPNTPRARVQMWTCNGSLQQQWYVERIPEGATRFRNAYSNTCLDIVDPSRLENGSIVYLWPCHDGPQQSFYSSPNASLNPGFIFATMATTQMVLDYDTTTAGDGGDVQMWILPGAQTPQQTWVRYPIDQGAHESWEVGCECARPKSEVFKLLCLPSENIDPDLRFANMCFANCGRNNLVGYSYGNAHQSCTQTQFNKDLR